MFIDTHCHLYKEYYDDINDVINLSKKDCIALFINAGSDIKSNKEILNQNIKGLYKVIGYHPEFASSITINDLELLENQIINNHIVGIGEIGLDYHYEGYDKEKQINLFEYQLYLAQKYSLPVVIHSRQATSDTINILKKYLVKGVINSFSGSIESAKEYIKMGFLLGVNGVITFKNCKLIEVYKSLGVDNIVFETDSPYLTPVPLRGKQNYPGNIKYVANFISENLNISLNKLSDITNENVKKCFKISI